MKYASILFRRRIPGRYGNQPAADDYTWYVDSVLGSDGNSGTQAQPFQTISKLLTVFMAGQSVGLAKGSHWDEQLTIPGNNCTIAAYGSGAMPILDCSTQYANASFTKTGGQTNIYQVTISTNYIASEPAFVGVWEDDTRLTYQSSLANCDANAGSYYMASSNATSIVVYVHASDSSDITTNGKVYEFSNRNSGIYGFGYTGITVTGIECRRNYALGGSLKVSAQATITSCIVRDGNSHNIYIGDGSTLIDVDAIGAYYPIAGFSMFIHNDATPAGLGLTFTRCTATLSAYDALATGFYGHVNTSGGFGTLTYTDCDTTNLANGFAFANCTTVNVSGGTHTDTRTVFNVANTGLTTISVSSVTQAATVSARFLFVAASITPPAITIDGCTITHGQALSNTATFYTGSDLTLTLTNNTITNNYTVASGCICLYAGGAGIDVVLNSSGNTFLTPNLASGPYIYSLQQNAGAGITSDHNHYDRETSWFHDGTNYTTLTAWKAGSGQDINSDIV